MLAIHALNIAPPGASLPPCSSRKRPFLFSFCTTLAVLYLVTLAAPARAQISLATAVDLALRSNPRVLGAEADVRKARAQLSETHDAYIPAIVAGAGLGQAYGYLPSPPTLFQVNAGSLVFGISQSFYIRSAKEGINAAQLAADDVRENVAQDTALAFTALEHDQQRESVIRQQVGFATTLVTIVQQRVDAGQDSQIDLTQAKLTAAQLRLAVLKAQDDGASDRDHLARLIGLPPASLQTDNAFPDTPLPVDTPTAPAGGIYANDAVASAFANADAKKQQAAGDARFLFWPQISLVTQYNRYATFTNSFKTLENLENPTNGNGAHIGADEAAFGVQISMPFYDKTRAAKARESMAEADRAYHDAQNAQIDALDGASRLRHSIDEIQAQAEVAALQQQLAQQQLDVIQTQMQSGTGNPEAPQMTPKDEQKARISERDKYLEVVDANFQLHQAEIQLLRQTGNLETWLRTNSAAPPSPHNPLPPSPAPQH
jgi:outer membrane protein TolC